MSVAATTRRPVTSTNSHSTAKCHNHKAQLDPKKLSTEAIKSRIDRIQTRLTNINEKNLDRTASGEKQEKTLMKRLKKFLNEIMNRASKNEAPATNGTSGTNGSAGTSESNASTGTSGSTGSGGTTSTGSTGSTSSTTGTTTTSPANGDKYAGCYAQIDKLNSSVNTLRDQLTGLDSNSKTYAADVARISSQLQQAQSNMQMMVQALSSIIAKEGETVNSIGRNIGR